MRLNVIVAAVSLALCVGFACAAIAQAGIAELKVMSDEVLELAMAEGVAPEHCKPDNFIVKAADGSTIAVAKAGRRTEPYRIEMVGWPWPMYTHHFFYLQLASPLKAGTRYTITMKEGAVEGREPATLIDHGGQVMKLLYKRRPGKGQPSVELPFDLDQTVSHAIKHNHIGYVASASHKVAYVGRWLGELGALPVQDRMKKFELVNAQTKEVAWKGDLRERKLNDPSSLEDVYDLDFGSVTAPGTYYLRCAGLGRSRDFRIADDVYAEVLFVTARCFFQQRCGMALEKQYTGWPRPACHNPPYTLVVNLTQGPGSPAGQEPFFNKYNNLPLEPVEKQLPEKFLTGEKITPGVIGGWHDAADYDRNCAQGHAEGGVWHLLAAYEMFPEKFIDGQFNLPESGNGIPDIIDEALWGVKLWMNLRRPDGSVYEGVEARRHPGDLPHEDKLHYFAFQPNPVADYRIAAAMAQTAHCLAKFKPKDAEEYLESAKKAYAWASSKSGAAADKPQDVKDVQAWAAAELFKATGDKLFEEDFRKCSKVVEDPNAELAVWAKYNQEVATMAYALCKRDNADKDLLKKVQAAVIRTAEGYIANMDLYGYRHPKSRYQPYSYGPGATGALSTREMAVAYHLTKDRKYLEAVYPSADFQLGAHPLGKSWITGLGHDYPIEPQHIISYLDGIEEAVPGIIVPGPAHVIKGWDRPGSVYRLFYPEKMGDLYRYPDFNGPAQFGELIIHLVGPVVFQYALLAPDKPQPYRRPGE
jgi:endoglucanase